MEAIRKNKSNQSKYKYVYKTNKYGFKKWIFKIFRNGVSTSKTFDNERDAALAVDKWLLNRGEEAVNILVKK